ncbi:MAG: 2-succinyl-5-enolpyruvyl-6-hydroxy-3-cyclohexene-1-carboxylic-acid synthase [Actinomycetaceae bacterium]|nr:2-succinyl-5-enolpyruvyl-6-hydroxy-3-cyclohexene-1-carboxylic-acid synthase [Arcanobacterium sp.]MDD7505226.1 2-succinyl-5-enolpyruvyl-6-hydroxy-3-cyclohexene-1-carboxylic-acid synthase [Actinomycetaceae bacterium]MDY6143314.1 2-succinyl-5-enolpyruvyl-6-hydroxy-3-cyclohexene-1-carboxylic-acid synthase [Arcanobacterium sp.]
MADATLTARSALAALIGEGVRHFVLCPGSRSAPLAYALSAAESAGLIDLVVETDERVAGFIALGYGKAGELAAVVTTSGSAVANLHPAVEEALHSGTGMVVLSADRPHELRGVRASQTTDHLAVLGGSVAAQFDIPTAYGTERALHGIIRRATRIALGKGVAGSIGPAPVHINIAFREPLFERDAHEASGLPGGLSISTLDLGVASSGELPSGEHSAIPASSGSGESLPASQEPLRTVVIAGSGDRIPLLRRCSEAFMRDPSRAKESREFDELTRMFSGVPILAEPSTILRALASFIAFHPLLLEHSELRAQIEQVIVIGHPTLTREVSHLLADPRISVIVVDDAPTYTDVSGNAAEIIDFEQLGAYLHADYDWCSKWLTEARRIEARASQYFSNMPELDFAYVARLVDGASERTPTVLAASSIIREVNLYGSKSGRVYAANRGLAGIDGTMSTAVGMSRALGRPVRVVLGDLAFIHDVGALFATALQARADVQIVVIDDAGGSLFATLEYGEGPEDPYDRAFRTEKRFDARSLADAFGGDVAYSDAGRDPQALWRALDSYQGGCELVYVNLGYMGKDDIRQGRAKVRNALGGVLGTSQRNSR